MKGLSENEQRVAKLAGSKQGITTLDIQTSLFPGVHTYTGANSLMGKLISKGIIDHRRPYSEFRDVHVVYHLTKLGNDVLSGKAEVPKDEEPIKKEHKSTRQSSVDITAIKEDSKRLSTGELARKYNVSYSYAWVIKNNYRKK